MPPRRRLIQYEMADGSQLVGLSPDQGRKGDFLCVVSGARIPFAIRETNLAGKYTLLGEVMAENFMHGQLSTLNIQSRSIALV